MLQVSSEMPELPDFQLEIRNWNLISKNALKRRLTPINQ
jgi:hypothetical protein